MQYKYIKKSSLRISEVSFGCMSLKKADNNSSYLVADAIDKGITLFDTADLYDRGGNEELLGAALKEKRKDVIISTKVGNRWRPDGSGWDWCPRKEYIMKAADDSLKRLQTDYIDLYLLHGGTIEDPIDEVTEAFERLSEQGKIKHYGLSSIRPNVIREYVKHSNIVAVMSQYSLLDRRLEEEIFPLLMANEIGILARGTIGGGLLVDKPVADYLNYTAEEVSTILEKLDKIIQPQRTRYEIALRYVIDNPAVTTAVVGIHNNEQLSQAVSATAMVLTNEETEKIKNLWPANIYRDHR